MGKIEEFSIDIEPLLQSPRKIWVYLPDSYAHTKKKYPVLFMFDGHNLFDDALSTYGKSWGIKEYLDKSQLDIVVIGQDCNHTGDYRLDEYCPFPVERDVPGTDIHACGQITGKWFTETLLPYCQKKYRIYKQREHVGIAGSSMGGLMSEFMISEYNAYFSKAGCISPANIFNYHVILNHIQSTTLPNTRVYLDLGSNEERSKKAIIYEIDRMLNINHAFTQAGCITYPNLVVDGTHSVQSWQKIFPVMLEFLYPELFKKE
ncbi:MAG: alpha/beta hydrolase-fold protein [Erysipelotrichaceae bacterium]|nr:alpha/beta hydrolase-fold protein [Erysipelotrichaceae bacterium]MDY6034109.1 alpha/beta hydrolase-fold protein [Bulleidia sp.]